MVEVGRSPRGPVSRGEVNIGNRDKSRKSRAVPPYLRTQPRTCGTYRRAGTSFSNLDPDWAGRGPAVGPWGTRYPGPRCWVGPCGGPCIIRYGTIALPHTL